MCAQDDDNRLSAESFKSLRFFTAGKNCTDYDYVSAELAAHLFVEQTAMC